MVQLLIRNGSSNFFHPRNSDGSRIEYITGASPEYWEVRTPDGTQYHYGSTSDSRHEVTQDSVVHTFRWRLSKVIDPRGNSYEIEYEDDLVNSDAVYIYPIRIRYSFHSSLASDHSQTKRMIEFRWAPRGSDQSENAPFFQLDADLPTSYRAGFAVQQRKRLRDVVVGIDTDGPEPEGHLIGTDEQIRRYELSYFPKPTYGDEQWEPYSQLASIQRYGKDDTAFPSSTDFDYNRPPRRFVGQDGASDPYRWEGTAGFPYLRHTVEGHKGINHEVHASFHDMNGDGLQDRVWVDGSDWKVNFGTTDGLTYPLAKFEATAVPWGMPASATPCSSLYATGLTKEQSPAYQRRGDLIDMDGDGLPDRVVGELNKWCVYKNDGVSNAFSTGQEWNFESGTQGVPSYVSNTSGVSLKDDALGTRHYWWQLVDINGDGLPDLARNFGGYASVFLNNGSGFDNTQPMWVPSHEEVSASDGLLTTTVSDGNTWGAFVDLNADGLPEFADSHICVKWQIGSVLVTPGFPALGFINAGARSGVGGLDKVSSWTNASGCYHDEEDFLNPFHRHARAEGVADHLGGLGTTHTLADMNGDGVNDYVVTVAGFGEPGDDRHQVYFGLGNGQYLYFTNPADPTGQNKSVTELGVQWHYGHYYTGPAGNLYSFRDHADIAEQGATGLDLIDVNGDGLLDEVMIPVDPENPPNLESDARWKVWLNPGRSGLLESVTNELGGVTTIEYLPSTHFKLADDAVFASYDNESPPAQIQPDRTARWLVSRVEVSDGRTGTATQVEDLEYAGLRWDTERREFFGARMAESQDAQGLITRSVFHQTPDFRGKTEVSEQCVYTAPGVQTCYSHEAIVWDDADNVAGEPYIAVPEKTTSRACDEAQASLCDNNGPALTRIVDRKFDIYGNLIEEVDYGPDEALDTDDDLITTISPIYNFTDWLINYPRQRSTFGGPNSSRTLLSQEQYSYDEDLFNPGAAPTQGLLRFRETLRDNDPVEVRVLEEWTYDSFGNQTEYYNPKDQVADDATRTTTWETDYNTYPETIANRLDETAHFLLDPELGKVLKVLEPNGYLKCWNYDDFGRLISREDRGSALPDPGLIEQTDCPRVLADFDFQSVTGNPNTQHILETLHPNATDEILSRRYFDGLGRVYQEEGEQRKGDFAVVTRDWGDRGELNCESLPLRTSGASIQSCGSTEPRRETEYDDVLRPTEIRLHAEGVSPITEVVTHVQHQRGNEWGYRSSCRRRRSHRETRNKGRQHRCIAPPRPALRSKHRGGGGGRTGRR